MASIFFYLIRGTAYQFWGLQLAHEILSHAEFHSVPRWWMANCLAEHCTLTYDK